MNTQYNRYSKASRSMCDLLAIIEMEKSTDSVASGCPKLELGAGIPQSVAGCSTVDVIVLSDEDEDPRPSGEFAKSGFSPICKPEVKEPFASESGVKRETEGGAVSPGRVPMRSSFSGSKQDELASVVAGVSLSEPFATVDCPDMCLDVSEADVSGKCAKV